MSDAFAQFAQARYFGVNPVGRIVGYASLCPAQGTHSGNGAAWAFYVRVDYF